MNIFSESEDYLKKIGVGEFSANSHTLSFPGEKEKLKGFNKIEGINSGMIILEERVTLYNTSLETLNNIRENISKEILSLICLKLTSPKGNIQRSWIQNQMGKYNFNINLILEDPIKTGISNIQIINLQKKICLGVYDTLKNFLGEDKQKDLKVTYPFHYTYKGAKIAGHLVQKNGKSMRIGIGINSNFSPQLADNDEMSQYIYTGTSHLNLYSKDWYNIGIELIRNIQKYINKENINDSFKDIINLKQDQSGTIYEDMGDIHFGKKTAEGNIDIGNLEDGKIGVGGKVFDYGYGHLVKK